MKKQILLITFSIIASLSSFAQSYYDDFESYTPGTYLCDSSNKWVTWNNAPGTSEDVQIDNSNSASGNNSIYFESTWGGGPQDVVLPFGGVHNTGHFKLSSKWYVTGKTGAYFNLQGGATIGSQWSMDVYMYDDGTLDIGGYLWGSYPQDQWFELVVDIDLTNNVWEVLVDGTSMGTFTNWTTNVSYMDIYPLFTAAFWVDDVSYCLNSSCLPDISLDALSISPDPICSGQPGDVTITLTNNGPDPAKSFSLGVAAEGQTFATRTIALNDLANGADTTITIPGLFRTSISGNGINVVAASLLGDRYVFNDTIVATVDVVKSPSGSELTVSTPFQGVDGAISNPDMIEVSKTNTYEITPPAGYSNSGYPSVWNISSIEVRTAWGDLLPGSAYQFTAPNGSSNGSISFTGSSTYLDSLLTISVRIENVSTGCDSVSTRKLRVIPTPEVNFKYPASICVGDDVAFENMSSIHSGFLTFMWYFGDGDTSDMNDPFHQYLTAGAYNVRLKAISHPYTVVKDTVITITVSEIPQVVFSVKNKCFGTPVEFANSSSVSTGTLTYDWDFGDGSSHSTATNPSHSYAAFGAYKVTLEAESNGCVARLTKTAYTFEKPVAAFTPPATPFCAMNPLKIDNESTISYGKLGTYWTFGDGLSTTQYNASHVYTQAGTYNVTLLAVSEFDCKDSITKTVVIKPAPQPAFIGNQFCGKIPTVFTNNTVEDIPNPVYTWNFSDGYSSNQKNLTRTWPTEGPYTVTLKAEYSNGCSAETSQNINVLIQPKADFTVLDICSGETASFVNLSRADRENVLYSWDFGNGTYSNLQSPVKSFSPVTTTTYTVALVASYAGACSDTMRKILTVSETPVCDFTFKDLGLLNTSFTPTVSSYSKYEWYFGEGGTSVLIAPMYQYLYSGNFNVTMKATNNAGCTCTVTKKVSATTSVNDLAAKSGISIYPNPNNGSFNIGNSSGSVMTVEIYNVLGEKIYSKTSSEDILAVHLNDKARGIYLVKVTVNGITTTTRITVNG